MHVPNSDTHTLFLSILILNSQCVGVANEVIDIWYIGVTVKFSSKATIFSSETSKIAKNLNRSRVICIRL